MVVGLADCEGLSHGVWMSVSKRSPDEQATSGANVGLPNISLPHAAVLMRATSLLVLDFRDRLLAADFAGGKRDLVAGVQFFQHVVRRLVLLLGGAAADGSDGAALHLLNADGPADAIDGDDRSRDGLLGQCQRGDDREYRRRQNLVCQFHRNLPVFESSTISRRRLIGSSAEARRVGHASGAPLRYTLLPHMREMIPCPPSNTSPRPPG